MLTNQGNRLRIQGESFIKDGLFAAIYAKDGDSQWWIAAPNNARRLKKEPRKRL